MSTGIAAPACRRKARYTAACAAAYHSRRKSPPKPAAHSPRPAQYAPRPLSACNFRRRIPSETAPCNPPPRTALFPPAHPHAPAAPNPGAQSRRFVRCRAPPSPTFRQRARATKTASCPHAGPSRNVPRKFCAASQTARPRTAALSPRRPAPRDGTNTPFAPPPRPATPAPQARGPPRRQGMRENNKSADARRPSMPHAARAGNHRPVHNRPAPPTPILLPIKHLRSCVYAPFLDLRA